MKNELEEPAKTVLDVIRHRRTLPYLKMKTDPIRETHLQLLLEAANWAPTHKYTEPWRFFVFDKEGRSRLAEVLGQTYREFSGDKFNEKKYQKTIGRVMTVPVTMAIIMQPTALLPEFEEILAVGCAVQNMHLAAQALGIGAAWSTPGYVDHPRIRELLSLQGRAKCFGFFYLGYPASDWPESKRKPIAEKVTRISQ